VRLKYSELENHIILCELFPGTLRIYPTAPLISQKCVKEYQVPRSDLKIEKGCSVMVPIVVLHHDPNYFPNPETFNPDQLSEDNKHSIQPLAYTPFGSGPRHCIGKKLYFQHIHSQISVW
jgi:cytochrome P450